MFTDFENTGSIKNQNIAVMGKPDGNIKTHIQRMAQHTENALPSVYQAIKALGYNIGEWHIFDTQIPSEIYGDIAFIEFHSNKSPLRLIAEIDVEGRWSDGESFNAVNDFTGVISTEIMAI